MRRTRRTTNDKAAGVTAGTTAGMAGGMTGGSCHRSSPKWSGMLNGPMGSMVPMELVGEAGEYSILIMLAGSVWSVWKVWECLRGLIDWSVGMYFH